MRRYSRTAVSVSQFGARVTVAACDLGSLPFAGDELARGQVALDAPVAAVDPELDGPVVADLSEFALGTPQFVLDNF